MKTIGGFSSHSSLLNRNDLGKNIESDKTGQSAFSGKGTNNRFRVPGPKNIPMRRATIRPPISPTRLVQSGRINNRSRLSQQMKMSLLPQRSFTNPRTTLTASRANQLNARKEILKKMVSLAEHALKENKEFKSATPLKVPAGLTPRKTPKVKGYMVLSECKNAETTPGVKTPLGKAFRSASRSNNLTPVILVKRPALATPEEPATYLPNDGGTLNQVLRHLRIYNTEVGFLYAELKILEECFEKNIKGLPDSQVYEEFCLYQTEKEKLYNELKSLEETLNESMKSQMAIGQHLKVYVRKRKAIFDKRTKLHKSFEEAVKTAIEKCQSAEKHGKDEETESKETTPQIRKSARLSQSKLSKEKVPTSLPTKARKARK